MAEYKLQGLSWKMTLTSNHFWNRDGWFIKDQKAVGFCVGVFCLGGLIKLTLEPPWTSAGVFTFIHTDMIKFWNLNKILKCLWKIVTFNYLHYLWCINYAQWWRYTSATCIVFFTLTKIHPHLVFQPNGDRLGGGLILHSHCLPSVVRYHHPYSHA